MVNNNINVGPIPLRAGSPKRNAAIIHVINSTCAFPALERPNVCWEEVLLLLRYFGLDQSDGLRDRLADHQSSISICTAIHLAGLEMH